MLRSWYKAMHMLHRLICRISDYRVWRRGTCEYAQQAVQKKQLTSRKHFSSSVDNVVAPNDETLKVKRSFIHPCSDLSARLPCIHWLSVWVCQEPSVSVHLHPPPQIPADPLADRIRGSGGMASLWGPLLSISLLPLRPGIQVAHSSSRYPREVALAGYIYIYSM